MTVDTFRTPAERLAECLASEGVSLPDAAEELSAFSHEQLAAARDALVGRLHHLPDDYRVGRALQAVYRAIAIKGWSIASDRREQMRSPRRHTRRGRRIHRSQGRRSMPLDETAAPRAQHLSPIGTPAPAILTGGHDR